MADSHNVLYQLIDLYFLTWTMKLPEVTGIVGWIYRTKIDPISILNPHPSFLTFLSNSHPYIFFFITFPLLFFIVDLAIREIISYGLLSCKILYDKISILSKTVPYGLYVITALYNESVHCSTHNSVCIETISVCIK